MKKQIKGKDSVEKKMRKKIITWEGKKQNKKRKKRKANGRK